jgi:hypothetical protein
MGTDNDYSVTQNGANIQFDVYVDFNGNSRQRDLDQPTKSNGIEVGRVPNGYVLISPASCMPTRPRHVIWLDTSLLLIPRRMTKKTPITTTRSHTIGIHSTRR